MDGAAVHSEQPVVVVADGAAAVAFEPLVDGVTVRSEQPGVDVVELLAGGGEAVVELLVELLVVPLVVVADDDAVEPLAVVVVAAAVAVVVTEQLVVVATAVDVVERLAVVVVVGADSAPMQLVAAVRQIVTPLSILPFPKDSVRSTPVVVRCAGLGLVAMEAQRRLLASPDWRRRCAPTLELLLRS